MSTKRDIIASAQTAFSNGPIPLDGQQAARHFDAVHRELCIQFPIYPSVETFSALVSGQREYDIDEDVVDVKVVNYYTSASAQPTRLCAFDADYRDRETYNWRQIESGTPREYYINGAKIGFVPTPNVSSSGSPAYPRVSCETYAVVPLGLDDRLPTMIRSDDVYVYGVRLRHAINISSPELIALYSRLYTEKMNEVDRFFMSRASEVDRTPMPDFGGDENIMVI